MLDVKLWENVLSKGSSVIAWVCNYIKDLAAADLLKSVRSVDTAAARYRWLHHCAPLKTHLQEETIHRPTKLLTRMCSDRQVSCITWVLLIYTQIIQTVAALSAPNKYLSGCGCFVHMCRWLCVKHVPALKGMKVSGPLSHLVSDMRHWVMRPPWTLEDGAARCHHTSVLRVFIVFLYDSNTTETSIDLRDNSFSSRNLKGACKEGRVSLSWSGVWFF